MAYSVNHAHTSPPTHSSHERPLHPQTQFSSSVIMPQHIHPPETQTHSDSDLRRVQAQPFNAPTQYAMPYGQFILPQSRPHPGLPSFRPETLAPNLQAMFPTPRFAPATSQPMSHVDLNDVFADFFTVDGIDSFEPSPSAQMAANGGYCAMPFEAMMSPLTASPTVSPFAPPNSAPQQEQAASTSIPQEPPAYNPVPLGKKLQLHHFQAPPPRTQQKSRTGSAPQIKPYDTRGRSVAGAAAAAAGTDLNATELAEVLQDSGRRKRKTRNDTKLMTEQQKLERRERNREHAKRSRIRKKVLLDSLQDQMIALRQENMHLRQLVKAKIPDKSTEILERCTMEHSILLSESMADVDLDDDDDTGSHSQKHGNTRILMEPDYRLIQALLTAQQNFVVSDPSLPDNPIVYASQGFLTLTGYSKDHVLGRNCRFLQGPKTDPKAVDIIRKGVAEGKDTSVCLLNYKADGKPFWNQFFVAALRDSHGNVVNYVGVQCEVNTLPMDELKERVKKLPIPDDL